MNLYRITVVYPDFAPKLPRITSHKVFGNDQNDVLRIANKYKIGNPVGRAGVIRVKEQISIEEAHKYKGKWFAEKDNKLVDLRPYT